ncbi:hypothetical protein ACFP2T_33255 [Plantactinospora solaniradicis]|uniref:Lipoprotein n=1 Tax=Plantactinospora solaniradicis TaxID=1723736 RepID=A0ABW1KJN5_9ACTN
MRPGRLALVACLALPPLAACYSGPATPTATPPGYSCCTALDVETHYQPGQTLTLHWTVVPGRGSPRIAPQVELTARLTGPYPDSAALKAATSDRNGAGEVTYPAAPVRPTGAVDERPVSVIQIGTDARPGLYNLAWSAAESGGAFSGASVIQVVAKA